MTNRRFRGWAASIAVLALMVGACSSGSSQSTKKAGAKAHEGVSVNVLTFTGPQIAEPLQRRAPEFQRLTGAKIKVVTVPFSDLYDKILTDFRPAYPGHTYTIPLDGDVEMVYYRSDLMKKDGIQPRATWDDYL